MESEELGQRKMRVMYRKETGMESCSVSAGIIGRVDELDTNELAKVKHGDLQDISAKNPGAQ